MKRTLLFSNVVENDWGKDTAKFPKFLENYLKKHQEEIQNLIFIDAPFKEEDDNYLEPILNCFKEIEITFDKVLLIDSKIKLDDLIHFPREKTVFFLSGGNPISQMELIKKYQLEKELRDTKNMVIGCCAGAINLSKHSIITSDEDFEKPSSYSGIGRVDLIIEPHYNVEETRDGLLKRNREIVDFQKKYHMPITAVPDTSLVIVEDQKVYLKGPIYHFD